jgi:hypothetical protein
MDKIIDNLYLGDIQAASNLYLLKKLVIDLSTHSQIGNHPHFASGSRVSAYVSGSNISFLVSS